MSIATLRHPHLRPAVGLRAATPLLIGLAVSVSPASAWAQQADVAPTQDMSAKFSIDPSNPEKSVPTSVEAMKNPLEMGYLMMDLIARAEAATLRRDHGAAVKYYRALSKAVPERAVSFSKLCESYEALGERERALDSCRQALGKGGVELDAYARFLHLTLQQTEPLSAAQVEELDSVVAHVETQLAESTQGPVVAALMACELATRLGDETRLRGCTDQLTALAPKDPRTFAFRWALAIQRHDVDSAQVILAQARQSGLPPAAISAMATQLEVERARPGLWGRLLREWGLLAGLTAAVVFGLALLGRKKHSLQTA